MANMFGGKPKKGNSLYVPMSDVEQECLQRIAELDGYRINIKGYGTIDNAHIIIGDKRLSFRFKLIFTKPDNPTPLYFLDLELLAFGENVFSERQHLIYGGKPQMVMAGIELELVWDIAIKHIEPRIVKSVVGTLGLTSRLQDKDSGAFTLTGNMSVNDEKRQVLHKLKEGERKIAEHNQRDIVEKVTKAREDQVKK